MTNVAHYRALVHKTATLLLGDVEDDFDDIVQVLWIKCWRAQLTFDPVRSRMTEDRYVFMCMSNLVKDLRKKRWRGEMSLEALAADLQLESVDQVAIARLRVDCEVVFAEVEDEDPLLPNTLTDLERQAIELLIGGYRQTEVATSLAVPKRDMERLMRSIRSKMADWKPPGPVEAPAELPIAA